MKTITSTSNEKIKQAVGVRKDGFGRGAIFIEGARALETVLKARGVEFDRLFVTARFISKKEGELLAAEITSRGAEAFIVSDEVMRKLSDTQSPQGAVALAGMEEKRLESIKPSQTKSGEINPDSKYFIVALDGLSEPGNVGAVVRAADAFGADAVVALSGTSDPFSPKAVRASAGSIFNVPVIICGRGEFIKWCKAQNISIMAASPRGGKAVFAADLTGRLAVIFGGEAEGVSGELESAAQGLIHVPMPGRAESLNVAQSAAICLYECQRQRRAAT